MTTVKVARIIADDVAVAGPYNVQRMMEQNTREFSPSEWDQFIWSNIAHRFFSNCFHTAHPGGSQRTTSHPSSYFHRDLVRPYRFNSSLPSICSDSATCRCKT